VTKNSPLKNVLSSLVVKNSSLKNK